jgi:hypothetical protein
LELCKRLRKTVGRTAGFEEALRARANKNVGMKERSRKRAHKKREFRARN